MRGRCLLGVATLGGLTLLGAAGCADDGDDPPATFGSIATSGKEADEPVTAAITAPAPGVAQEGYVAVRIRLGATGVEEVVDLDRASVDPDDLQPISLDAQCSALDGGTGYVVSVVDLRRVAAGQRIVSALLRIDADVGAPGAFQGTLDVGDNRQVVTTYSGSITIDEGLASGRFDLRDARGQTATGTFTCDEQAPPPPASTTTAPTTTTTIPLATS